MTVALLLGLGFAFGVRSDRDRTRAGTALAARRACAPARTTSTACRRIALRRIARLLAPQDQQTSDLVRRLVDPIRRGPSHPRHQPRRARRPPVLVAALGLRARRRRRPQSCGSAASRSTGPGRVAISLGLASIGSFVPSLGVHSDAVARRRTFRHALGCYLDLVAIRLAGGAGVETALVESAEAGRGPAFDAIRHALDEARLLGEPPWPRLAQLGTDLGVRELEELAASAELAGDEGARVRASISAKARTIRLRGLDGRRERCASRERAHVAPHRRTDARVRPVPRIPGSDAGALPDVIVRNVKESAMPELVHLHYLVNRLRAQLHDVAHDERGEAMEKVIITAIFAALAIAVGAIIVARVTDKANSIQTGTQ